jgi:hypothetical protein
MKTILLPFCLIFLLCSCSLSDDAKNTHIEYLEAELEGLKLENAELRNENVLLRAGGIPPSPGTSG